MSKGELNGEQKSVVWRYVEIWRRWRRLPSGYRSFAGLDDDMAQGFGMLLCGILVAPQPSSVIIADTKDPEFFAAIFGSDNNAVPDMTPDELEEAREYIMRGEGTVPVRKRAHDA